MSATTFERENWGFCVKCENLEKEKGHIGEVVVDLSGGGRGRGG